MEAPPQLGGLFAGGMPKLKKRGGGIDTGGQSLHFYTVFFTDYVQQTANLRTLRILNLHEIQDLQLHLHPDLHLALHQQYQQHQGRRLKVLPALRLLYHQSHIYAKHR